MNTKRQIICIGGGGHARQLLEKVSLEQDQEILGFVDVQAQAMALANVAIPYLGADQAVLKYKPTQVDLLNGIGSVADHSTRTNIFLQFVNKGYRFYKIIHPHSIISPSATIGEGVQVMAAAILQTNVLIQQNVLINTGAIVEHDCTVGAHTHIAPGAIVCGGVNIGTQVFIGAGATVIQGLNLGDNSIIAAGACVTKDVAKGQVVMGVPAKTTSSTRKSSLPATISDAANPSINAGAVEP